MISIDNPFRHHRTFIAAAVVVVLIIGLSIGAFLAGQLGTDQLGIVAIGISFTNSILLLIIGSLVLDIKEILQIKKRGKK